MLTPQRRYTLAVALEATEASTKPSARSTGWGVASASRTLSVSLLLKMLPCAGADFTAAGSEIGAGASAGSIRARRRNRSLPRKIGPAAGALAP